MTCDCVGPKAVPLEIRLRHCHPRFTMRKDPSGRDTTSARSLSPISVYSYQSSHRRSGCSLGTSQNRLTPSTGTVSARASECSYESPGGSSPPDPLCNPVVLNAGFTFHLKGPRAPRVYAHLRADPSGSGKKGSLRSSMTRQVDDFLRRSDHSLDQFQRFLRRRSSPSGKNPTPSRPTPSTSGVSSSSATQGAPSSNFAAQAERHRRILAKVVSRGRALRSKNTRRATSSSSSDEDFFESDSELDDTSAEISKLVAMEVPQGASRRSCSVEPSAHVIDDLTSGSEEEYFDVHPSPGFCIPGRPQINFPGVQGPIVSGPLAGSNRGCLPIHSHSLPSINKVHPLTKMGNVQPGTVPTGGTPQEGLQPHAATSPSSEPHPVGIRLSASKTSLNTNSLKKKYAAPPVPSVSPEPSFKESGSPRSHLNDSLMSVDSCSVVEIDGSPLSRKPHRNPSFKKYRAPPPPSSSPKTDPNTQDNASVISNYAEPPVRDRIIGPLLESVPSTDSVAPLRSDAQASEATPKGGAQEAPRMTLSHLNAEESVPASLPLTDSKPRKEGDSLMNGFEEEGSSEVVVANEDEKQRPEDSSPPAKSAEENKEFSKKKKKKAQYERKSTKAPAPNPVDKHTPPTTIGSGRAAIKEENSVGCESGEKCSWDKGPSDSKEKVKEIGTPLPSEALMPESKSKVVYKRTMSGKLASLTNKFEAEDKTLTPEAKKPISKSGSSTKVGKLGVLTSKFSGDKSSASLGATSDRKGSVGDRIFPMGSVGDVANVFEKNLRKKSIGGIDITKFGSFVKPVDYLNVQKTKKEIDAEKFTDIDPSAKMEGSNKCSQVAVAIDSIVKEPSTESPQSSKSSGLTETVEDPSKETESPPFVSASHQTKVFVPTHQKIGESESRLDIKAKTTCSLGMSDGHHVIEHVVETRRGPEKPRADDSVSLSMIPNQNEFEKRVAPAPPTNFFAPTKEDNVLIPTDGECKLSQIDEGIKVVSLNVESELSSIDSENKLEEIEEGSKIQLFDANTKFAAIDADNKVVSPDAEKELVSNDESSKVTPLEAASIVPENKLPSIEEGSEVVPIDLAEVLMPIDSVNKFILNDKESNLVTVQGSGDMSQPIDSNKESMPSDTRVKMSPTEAELELVSNDIENELVPFDTEKKSPSHTIESRDLSERTPKAAPQTGDLLASAPHQSSAFPDSLQETLRAQPTPIGSPDKEFFVDALEAFTHPEAVENVIDRKVASPGAVVPVASDSTTNHSPVSGLTQSHNLKILGDEPDKDLPLPSQKGNDCTKNLNLDAVMPPGIDQPIVSQPKIVESKVELLSDITHGNVHSPGPLPSSTEKVLVAGLVQIGTGPIGGGETKECRSLDGVKCPSPFVDNDANIIGSKTIVASNEASCLSLTPFDSLKGDVVDQSRLSFNSFSLPLKLDGMDRKSRLNDVTSKESRLTSISPPLKPGGQDRNTISSPLGAPSKNQDMLDEVHHPMAAASTSKLACSLQPSEVSAKTNPSCDVCHAKTMTTTSTISSVANEDAPTTLAQMSKSVLTLRSCAEKRVPAQPLPTLPFQLWNNNREDVRRTSVQRRCSSQMNFHPASLEVSQARSLFPQARSLSDLVCNQKDESPVATPTPSQLSVRPKIRRRSYDKPLPDEVLNISEILRDVEARLSKAVAKPEPVARPFAYDPSSLDTLMPLPDSNDIALGERRSRSSTPFRDRSERSPTPNPVFKQTEALLTETDRILRKTRSHHSLRRSFTRSLSGINIHRLTEVTADLNEEHTTAQIASERIEAEQSDRMRLEKEVAHLQAEIKRMTTTNDKLEMERLHLKHEVLQHVELNGEVEGEALGEDSSLYKRKYEWCLHEIDVLKKQLKQQQEDDLDQIITLKKQLEKKVADAAEESDERRQVVTQVKKKSQRLQAEMNDLKILLEEQTSRNNLLEKKQRKFDQDMASLVEEQRTERSAKEKIQRERDQILAEKYSFEQEVATLKLELELKDEKLSSVNKELDDLNFSGKVDEEVALLKKAKHDLELRVKDQEEELDDLAGQVQMLESAKVRLEMSIEQMRKENRKELSQRDEEVEEVRLSAQKKVKALEAQLEGEHEERTQLVRAKHELERRLVEAHSQGVSTVEEDQFHRLKKELRKTKALLKDTQTMLEKTQAEGSNKLLLRQLKTQLEDAEFAKMAAIKAKQCADSDLCEVQTQLEEVQRSRKETEERLTRVTKEKSEMQTQLEESEEEAAEVMKKYKATVSQLSVDQISISEQAQLIADLEHDKQVLQDKLSELSSKVEVLEGETANIHTQRRLQMKIKELESKLDLESTTRQRLESQIARLKDQVERVSSDGDSLRLKESQAAEHAKKLSRQLREAKEDGTNLQARLTDALSRRQEVEKQYELAESEIVTLKGDLKLAFKRIEDLQQALQGDISDSDTEISDSGSENEASFGSFLTGTNNSPYRTTSPDSKGDLMGPSINDLMSVIKEDVEDDFKESFA